MYRSHSSFTVPPCEREGEGGGGVLKRPVANLSFLSVCVVLKRTVSNLS